MLGRKSPDITVEDLKKAAAFASGGAALAFAEGLKDGVPKALARAGGAAVFNTGFCLLGYSVFSISSRAASLLSREEAQSVPVARPKV